MRHKNFNVLGILFLFGIVLFSMSFVSAVADTASLDFPAEGANVTGTYVLSVTIPTVGDANLSYAWFKYMYVNGTNITIASHVANTTDKVWNTSWNSAGVNNNNLTFWVTVGNETNHANGTVIALSNSTSLKPSVIVNNRAPTVLLLGYVNGTVANQTNITINVSVMDFNMSTKSACKVDVNGTNQTFLLTAINSTSATCNTTTLYLMAMTDGKHTIKVYANNSVGLWGQIATSSVFIDAIAPSVSLDATDITKDTITLAITATDGTGTGVSSCTVDRAGATVSGITSLTESGLSCATSYTHIVTCSDSNGHGGSATKTVSTNACGGSAGSGSSGASKPVVNTVSEIKPGVASVTKFTDAATGVKQIEITVNNPAQSVQITVTKYDGKPAAVSVVKSGTVYQYVQISTQNLADKLANAKVQFQVEKSKVSDKNKVVVSKFDETGKKWNDLSTTFASEDSKFYYYDVEVSSFSYFAISESALVAGDNTAGNGTGSDGTGSTSSLIWLWIVIGLVVLALLIWAVVRKK